MDEKPIKVIVGLGNPGSRYARTRHNIGFMALDAFAARLGKPRLKKTSPAFIREDYQLATGDVILIRPQLFMNLSGEALRRTGLNLNGLAGSILVVFDDVSIEFGRVRVRRAGSAGGHKGMKNVIDVLESLEVPRLRLGVGAAPRGTPLDKYVLAPFVPDEYAALPDFLSRAADTLEMILSDGLDAAMEHFNSPPPTDD